MVIISLMKLFLPYIETITSMHKRCNFLTYVSLTELTILLLSVDSPSSKDLSS